MAHLFEVMIKKRIKHYGLKKKTLYPVYHIDVEKIIQKIRPPELTKKEQLNLDEDDFKFLDKKFDQRESEQGTILWLLIGDRFNHKLVWVCSNDTAYYASPR